MSYNPESTTNLITMMQTWFEFHPFSLIPTDERRLLNQLIICENERKRLAEECEKLTIENRHLKLCNAISGIKPMSDPDGHFDDKY